MPLRVRINPSHPMQSLYITQNQSNPDYAERMHARSYKSKDMKREKLPQKEYSFRGPR